jgi:hypothetical protein
MRSIFNDDRIKISSKYMNWFRDLIEKASIHDFINRATIKREEQFKIEEKFDSIDSDVVVEKCGERVLIELFKTRSELNRELTRDVNDHSLLTRGDAYDYYLDRFDKFHRDIGNKTEDIRVGSPDACTDLVRSLEDFKDISNYYRSKRRLSNTSDSRML